jgi:hypothetical protein
VSPGATTWLVAVLQIGTAIGIVVFWVTWLRTAHDEPWLPVGFVEHERAFVLPDSVLALLLGVSAVLQFLDHELGGPLALIAAGMLLFLGLIDAAYFARTGLFARDRGGIGNAAIVVWMLLLAVLLLARHL